MGRAKSRQKRYRSKESGGGEGELGLARKRLRLGEESEKTDWNLLCRNRLNMELGTRTATQEHRAKGEELGLEREIGA